MNANGVDFTRYPIVKETFKKLMPFAISQSWKVLPLMQEYTGDTKMTLLELIDLLELKGNSPYVRTDPLDAAWTTAFNLPNGWVALNPFNSDEILIREELVRNRQNGKVGEGPCGLYGLGGTFSEVFGCMYWGVVLWKKQVNLPNAVLQKFLTKLFAPRP